MNVNYLEHQYAQLIDLKYKTSSIRCYTKRDKTDDRYSSEVILVFRPDVKLQDTLEACLDDVINDVRFGAKVILINFCDFITQRTDDNLKKIDLYEFRVKLTSRDVIAQICVQANNTMVRLDTQFQLYCYKNSVLEPITQVYANKAHQNIETCELMARELQLADAFLRSLMRDDTLTELQDACNIPKSCRTRSSQDHSDE